MEKKFTKDDIKNNLNMVLDELKKGINETVDKFADETVDLTYKAGPIAIYELIGIGLMLMQQDYLEREAELFNELMGEPEGPAN